MMHDQAGRQLGAIPPRDRAGVLSYLIAGCMWICILFVAMALWVGVFVILKALVESL